MKKEYGWYSPLSKQEIENAWKTGILTVDTNVLLDLYRYNEKTKDMIISAIQSFGDRVWITAQVAEEFIKNRRSVIVNSTAPFDSSYVVINESIKSIDNIVSKLKSNKLIGHEIIDKFQLDMKNNHDELKKSIDSLKEGHPKYLEDDVILRKIMDIFDNKLGKPYSKEDLEMKISEGIDRVNKKIPPGFSDANNKGAENSWGDYVFWSQIIDHGVSVAKPVILVTSETKEDWWESVSGKTLGPRLELIKEAKGRGVKNIIIYKTDGFINKYSEIKGNKLDEEAIEEIRNIGENRYVFSSINAVSAAQIVTESSDQINRGAIKIILNRPLPMMTGSGKLNPRMIYPPKLSVSIISKPEEAPDIAVVGNTGTVFDFNIHVSSRDNSKKLPIGEYLVEYVAYCGDDADMK